MSLQYISDIHLEHYNINQIDKLIPNKLSEILILAGDIGYPEQTQYKMYIDKVSKIWSKVFIISGNHEYYQTSKKIKNKEEIDLIIESIVEDYSNVYYLNNSKIEFEYDGKNFVILGTTLFSFIEKDNYSLQISINDFKYIYTKRTPSFECIDNVYKNSKLNKAYYSDLEYLIKDLYCWIHGHTHSQKVVKINGISILNNRC
jgi:predicted phosphodiesterase